MRRAFSKTPSRPPSPSRSPKPLKRLSARSRSSARSTASSRSSTRSSVGSSVGSRQNRSLRRPRFHFKKQDIPEDIVYDTAINLKPYTCASFHAALLRCSCAQLAHYGRLLLPGVSLRGIDKSQRAKRLILAVREFKYGLAGDNHKTPVVSASDFAKCGNKKNILFSRSLGERIVCAIDAAYERNKLIMDAEYARARNGKSCKAPAAYGSGDGNDCARGFEERDGCCFAKMFRTEESTKLLAAIDRDPDMSAEQKLAYTNFLAAPPLPEFDIADKGKGIALAFIANTQAQLYDSLSVYFGDVMAASPEEWDACKDDHWWNWALDKAKFAASLAKNGISALLKFLYKVLERVGGVWLFKQSKFLVGKTLQVVSTAAQKLAAFIATHPAQARAMLAGFKYFRDIMATDVAKVLDKAGVFGSVDEHYKNATPEQRLWFCQEADESMASSSLVHTILYYTFGENQVTDVLNLIESSGWFDPISWLRVVNFRSVTSGLVTFFSSALSVIPVVGNVLGSLLLTFSSTISEILGNALQETASTIVYVQDVKECLFLIVDILDITPCLEKWGPIQLKYPNLWMFLYSLQRKRRKMIVSESTKDALIKSREQLDRTVKNAIGAAGASLTGEPQFSSEEQKLSLCGYEQKVIMKTKEDRALADNQKSYIWFLS